MKTILLNTAAAAALVLGMSAASAQTSGSGSAGGAVEVPPAAGGEMKADPKDPKAAQGGTKADTKAGTSAEGATGTKAGGSAEGAKQGGDMKSGRAAAPTTLTSEQKTVIRDKVVSRADRVNVNFNIGVGTIIPGDIRVRARPLPPELVTIYPDYSGYSYIVLADGRIVVIEPQSYEIVTIVSL